MPRRIKVLIVLSYDQDPVRWRERFSRGETFDETPYGYQRAEREFDVTWAVSHVESSLVRRVRHRLIRRLGYDLIHAWRNRAAIRAADVIWTHTEREHLAVARVDRGRTPVIAQSVWLWDEWGSFASARQRAVAALLRTHPIELTHSVVNRDASRAAVPGRAVELVPFGSAGIEVQKMQTEAGLVVAVGNDRHRDWATLADAARELSDLRFRVVSGNREARELAWPANVECRPATGRREIAECYSRASCVVVPLRENLHASGTTTTIEALSAGRPLVVTDVGGIADYVRGAATLVPGGSASALATGIREATRTPAAGDTDEVRARGLRQADYVERYAAITRALVAGVPIDPRVHQFVPVAQVD